jgi:hypothetical protein
MAYETDDPARERQRAERARAQLRAELVELKQSLARLLDALEQAPVEPAQSAVITAVVSRPTLIRFPTR